MLSFNKIYIKGKKPYQLGSEIECWPHSTNTILTTVGGCMWTAAVRWISVWLLKGKAFFIKGTLSSRDAPIKTSWLHPGSPALGFHRNGRGGHFRLKRSLVNWLGSRLYMKPCLLAPISTLPTPYSIHRFPGGEWILEVTPLQVTLFRNSLSEICPWLLQDDKISRK